MRTSIDIDDQTYKTIRRKAAEEGLSLKAIVNRALVRELHGGWDKHEPRPAYRCPVFSMGEPGQPLDKALRLADELEDNALISKLEIRK